MANPGTAWQVQLESTLFSMFIDVHRRRIVPRRRLPSPGNWIWNPTRCCRLDRSHSIRCWICWFSETWDETSRSWTLNVFAPSCRQVRALVLLDLLDKGWILVTWCAAKICPRVIKSSVRVSLRTSRKLRHGRDSLRQWGSRDPLRCHHLEWQRNNRPGHTGHSGHVVH